ncbi:MAG TPA: FAD-binding oxidoreductase [Euzebya sp.]|nr:FAD-binding oxidoreductase [Euzebya sp.]
MEADPTVGRSWWLDACPVAEPPVLPVTALEAAMADVVVVGLGASGLEAIGWLARLGVDVIGLDAVGVAAGAAGANGGFLLAGLADFHHRAVGRHGRHVAVDWWWRSVDELDRLAATEPTFRRVGSVRVAASAEEQADIGDQLQAMRADGLGAQPYDGPEGIGLLVPTDGAFHPVARCRRLAAEALAAGARLVAPARVTSVQPGHVEVGEMTVRTAALLVAVDGGLERLRIITSGGAVQAAGVRTARLQMLATAPDPGVSLPRPVYRRHGYDYAQQLPSGEVLLGGGRDVGGEDEWGAGPVPSVAVQAHLDRWLAQLGGTAPVTRRWAAHAAFSDDHLPWMGHPAPRVHVVGGYSGHGNVIGGLLARQAARDIVAQLP